MDIPNVEKKIREARFFLSKMGERGNKAFGDHEGFDFYLSAFLSAARTVDYRLRHEQGTLYRPWRTKWDAALPAPDNRLMEVLANDRNVEVHESGSKRDEEVTGIPVGNTYSDAGGSVCVSSPPGTPAGVVHKPDYYFTIDGTQRKATESCAEYLRLLDGMVAKFKADNP